MEISGRDVDTWQRHPVVLLGVDSGGLDWRNSGDVDFLDRVFLIRSDEKFAIVVNSAWPSNMAGFG